MRDADGTDFLSFPDLLKARPVEDGGLRFLFIEASNEARDFQGEIVLAKAMAESASYYRDYGNVDLDHITVFGPKAGLVDYPLFEIGRPVEVKCAGRDTFVKAAIYTGDTDVCANANRFWHSVTRTQPAQRWFPSVGGSVLERKQDRDPKTGAARVMVTKVRWTNIGLSKTPVNPAVPEVSTVPFGILAKSWTAHGLDLTKAMAATAAAAGGLSAGAHVSPEGLEGGGALREQSLEGAKKRRRPGSYWEFRDAIAGDLRKAECGGNAEAITEHATRTYGLDPAEAADWCGRFLTDLRAGLQRKREH